MVNPENNVMPQHPVSKKEYLKTMASEKVKKASQLALILTLVCVVVMVIGYIVAMNTSIENIPVVSMTIEDPEAFEEMKEEAEEAVEDVEDKMDDYEDELEELLSKKDMKQLEKFVKAFSKTADCISINNLKSTIKALDKLADDASEILNLDNVTDDIQEMMEILGIISTVMIIFMLIALLFTVLGGLCKVNGLVVVGAILTTIYCLLFCGILIVILNLAAHIALIYMQGQGKKEYKAYRAGALNA